MRDWAIMGFLIRIVVNAFAIWVVTLMPALQVTVTPFPPPGETLQLVLTLLVVALIFALVNTIVGTVIKIVAIPLYVLTLGLISLVINGFLLWLTAAITGLFGWGLHVGSFWWGIVAALIIGIINAIFGGLLRPQRRRSCDARVVRGVGEHGGLGVGREEMGAQRQILQSLRGIADPLDDHAPPRPGALGQTPAGQAGDRIVGVPDGHPEHVIGQLRLDRRAERDDGAHVVLPGLREKAGDHPALGVTDEIDTRPRDAPASASASLTACSESASARSPYIWRLAAMSQGSAGSRPRRVPAM